MSVTDLAARAAHRVRPTIRLLTCIHYLLDGDGPTVKGCLAAMAEHVDEDGVVFLRHSRIAHMSGYKLRTVREAIQTAETRGYLETIDEGQGRGRVPRYRVLLLDRYEDAAAAKHAWKPAGGAGFENVKLAPNCIKPAPHCKNGGSYQLYDPDLNQCMESADANSTYIRCSESARKSERGSAIRDDPCLAELSRWFH